MNERCLSLLMSHLSILSQERRCYLQLVQVEDEENGCLEAIIKNDLDMKAFGTTAIKYIPMLPAYRSGVSHPQNRLVGAM